jgi:hypothetical protein
MISIANYQTTLTPFTLLEKTTFPLSATTYILQLNGKELHDETLLFLTGDTSANVNRYNYFPINLTPLNLTSGQYDYTVWQNTGTTLSTSALTINDVVETGLATIYGTTPTPDPVYVPTGQTQYVFI